MKIVCFLLHTLSILLLFLGSFAVNTNNPVNSAVNGVLGSIASDLCTSASSSIGNAVLNASNGITDTVQKIEFRENERLQQQINDHLQQEIEPEKETTDKAKDTKSKCQFRCAVKTCRNRGTKGFYKIPDNPARRNQWLDKIKLSEVKKSAKVCYRHFRPDQFCGEIDEKKGIFGQLKKYVIPTECLPGEPFVDQKIDNGFDGEIVIEPPQKREFWEVPVNNPETLITIKSSENEHNYTPETFDPYERIKRLERKNQLLKNKNAALMSGKKVPKTVQEKIVHERLKHKFTPATIHCMLSKKKLSRCMKWQNEDYNNLFRIRSLSPKCVKILKKDLNFPAPGISTVDKKYSFFHVPLKIITPALELLKLKSKLLTERQKNCGVCFDEIFIDNTAEIDLKLDEVLGPGKQANVLFVRSYCGDLKYPVYWDIDSQLSVEELNSIIIALEDEAGLKIHSVTCDQGIV